MSEIAQDVHPTKIIRRVTPLRSDTHLPASASLPLLARSYTRRAVDLLGHVLCNEDEPTKNRITAAQILLDRGWGRAAQSVEINVTNTDNVRELSRDALLAIASGSAEAAVIEAVQDEED